MTTTRARTGWAGLFLQEDLNFLLTNRIPRQLATRLMGRFSRIESRWLTRATLAVWRRFAPDLDFRECVKDRFDSLHDCFVRELRPGARPIDMDPGCVVSPCDAVVGELGRIDDGTLIQAKGFPYRLEELTLDPELTASHADGTFVTLRLRASMYHRFHAPEHCRVRRVDYISGDTWNVNPIALRRVERLFCRNERAVIELELADPGERIALVPVAAILVASLRLHCLPGAADLRSRGRNRIHCDASYRRGDEMGWFQHGSTIVLLAGAGFAPAPGVTTGTTIRMGQPLLVRRAAANEDPRDNR